MPPLGEKFQVQITSTVNGMPFPTNSSAIKRLKGPLKDVSGKSFPQRHFLSPQTHSTTLVSKSRLVASGIQRWLDSAIQSGLD